MKSVSKPQATDEVAPTQSKTSGRLFRKYVALFLVVGLTLVPSGLLDVWFSYQEQQDLFVRIQREQAKAAAEKIGQFVAGIEGQLGWAVQVPLDSKSSNELRYDAMRLLRQAPAVTEISLLDASGHERYRASRQAADVVNSMIDFSKDPAFLSARANKTYYGPVYFVNGSEPYMAIALGGLRPEDGVVVAQVNLKFIWDVVSQIRVGKRGLAYVIDSRGQLIAHPDISLVLREVDLSHLPYVAAARAVGAEEASGRPIVAIDPMGHKALNAYARVAPLDWLVFTELPIEEAYAPLYATLIRSALLLVAALALAVFCGLFLARRMMVPIRALHDGAARIGSGDLAQPILINTGDELEALGGQFNRMAERLQDSYATLERKVEERTQQLELANRAKSRFIAAASHDLRQPLHALGLFFAQLQVRMSAAQRHMLLSRIEAALSSMNELFNALLDISKLEAGALTPNITEFPVAELLKRVETTFAGPAQEKGLSLRVVPASGWVRSDFILLERIVFNLVANAVRYTNRGGIVVGCRHRGGSRSIEVCDTGPGIPADQYQNIFSEFYRIGEADRGRSGGLGLGLSIVERLCHLLDHPIALDSTVGRGSRFAVSVSVTDGSASRVEAARVQPDLPMPSNGQLVAVIDDDQPALDGMKGLLLSWGYRVAAGRTDTAALARLAEYESPPDLIISDYRLANGMTGIDVIDRLRRAMNSEIPAFLISGDTDTQVTGEARMNGYCLMHKPVDPLSLRGLVSEMLKEQAAGQERRGAEVP